MTESLSETLQRDLDCDGLLECFHDLRDIDKEVFRLLDEADGYLTVDAIADQIDRDRSTAYRSVQRLLHAGLLDKEQVNYDQGGYYHHYSTEDTETITQEMQQMLNEWYAKMGQLIEEFGDEYGDEETRRTPFGR